MSEPDNDDRTLAPLPGEAGIPDVAQPRPSTMSRKSLFTVGVLVASLIAVSAFSIQRCTASGKKTDEAEQKQLGDRPVAATSEPRKLELLSRARASEPATSAPRIPALIPTAEEAAPIGLRRGSGNAATPSGSKPVLPEDAPAMLVTAKPQSPSTRAAPSREPTTTDINSGPARPTDDPLAATARNLEDYQRQLQGLMDTLTRSTALATREAVQQPSAVPRTTVGVPPLSDPRGAGKSATGGSSGLFGGALQGSSTSRVEAGQLGNRSLTLPKGTAFTCALKTKVISATSGLVGCQVQRNVYSDDGRVLLVERGSHLDGEYRVTSVRPGTVRIPVLWTRLRTPHGVTVDIDSPGTGALGESGIDGHVDNRWGERIGAALLLSVIDDSVQLIIQNQSNERQGDTIVLSSTTSNASKLAEKVLDSTINIPPLIYQNQGGIVGIYVARDVDFSSVYDLKVVPR
ncbi:MAG: type IV secretion system protein VirB10 [Burkholderiaceae bacterium]|nr:type IV secretion system protein VirB10 [Burkholderiaceae bacterium]